jgi:hypothetical protein
MSFDPQNPTRRPGANRFPRRRALSDAEIQERLLKAYDILLEAARDAELRQLHVVPPPEPPAGDAPPPKEVQP